jgi:predicted esterase
MNRFCLVSIALVAWISSYAIQGTRDTVNQKDGLLVENITPVEANPRRSPSAAPNQPGRQIYDYTEAVHKFRLVVPDGLAVVRGILLVGPYAGGDSRDYYRQIWYREFLHLHGFAFLGAKDFYLQDYQVLQHAVAQLATDSKHPELVHAPFAATGFSAGGGTARRLLMADPDRLIAAVIVGSTLKLNGKALAANLGTPVCVINGDLEHEPGEAGGMARALEPVLAEYLPHGARWAWMAVQGVGHEMAGQEVLAMPMLDAAVMLRYPADGDARTGPVKLKAVDLESGWVADNTTWKSSLTSITPAKEFQGTIARSTWLLNEDIAFIYRAYATHDCPLKITSPSNMSARDEVFDAGADVTIKVDDSKFAGWTKLDLYDGAKKAGELTKGPAEFTVKDLKAGYHAYSVLGTDGKGFTRTSAPVLVVVRSRP